MVEKAKGFSKTCYYEVLDVDRKADTKTIERAYKKAALKWHPDKNSAPEAEAPAPVCRFLQGSSKTKTNMHGGGPAPLPVRDK